MQGLSQEVSDEIEKISLGRMHRPNRDLPMPSEEAQQETDLWSLTEKERTQLYNSWVIKHQDKLFEQLKELEVE